MEFNMELFDVIKADSGEIVREEALIAEAYIWSAQNGFVVVGSEVPDPPCLGTIWVLHRESKITIPDWCVHF